MNNTTPQLPVEILQEIKSDAEAYANSSDVVDPTPYEISVWKECYTQGATSYATKRLQDQQEIAELKHWKEEAKAIINPIWDYADTLKVPFGKSKTEAVVQHVKEAKALLHEVLVMNEAWGDLPGEFINKVNKFLYGE
jgi:hypothetical protein